MAWYDGTIRVGGTHLPDRRLVPRRQATRDHPLGAGTRSRGHSSIPRLLLCTDPVGGTRPSILEWFVLRWQLEVTPYQVRGRLFQEVRTHLGVEIQCQWSDLAIARTTPILLGLFLLDHPGRTYAAGTSSHHPAHRRLVRQTIADLRGRHRPGAKTPVAGVRGFFELSAANPDTYRNSPPPCTTVMVDSLAYAA